MTDTHAETDPLDARLEDMYGDLPMSDEDYDALVDQSLNPCGPERLWEQLESLGLTHDAHVVDVGCREGKHALRIAETYGCSALGIDPIARHVRLAQDHIAAAPDAVAARVRVEHGRIEAIPAADASVELIWSRDMLNHVPDLEAGLKECARVLKPGGHMLIYQTFATDRLEAREAAWIFDALAVVPDNMDPARLEATLERVGLDVMRVEVIGSQWRERWEEEGVAATSKQLLRLARMRRNREALVEALGESVYLAELADCHWGVYQMLGKLEPRIVLARRR